MNATDTPPHLHLFIETLSKLKYYLDMVKDLHESHFNEGTLIKLKLYQMYLAEWLPVFLRGKSRVKKVNIFDFFAGPGKSPSGQIGSPLIANQEVKNYYNDLRTGKASLTLYFNELSKKKLGELKANLLDDKKVPFSIEFGNYDFAKAFQLWKPKMENAANLIFLDQNGVKQVTKDIFQQLANIKGTDFLFFISSSFVSRFGETKEFQKYFGDSVNSITRGGYGNIHRNITEHYRTYLPDDADLYLAPFSIQKEANIYGLVFGTRSPLGILKYLRCCWKLDGDTGEANYDIDNDNLDPYRTGNQQSLIFMNDLKPNKVNIFELELREKIISGAFETDRDILHYALQRGFITKHITPVIRKLKQDGYFNFKKGNALRFSKLALNEPRKIELLK